MNLCSVLCSSITKNRQEASPLGRWFPEEWSAGIFSGEACLSPIHFTSLYPAQSMQLSAARWEGQSSSCEVGTGRRFTPWGSHCCRGRCWLIFLLLFLVQNFGFLITAWYTFGGSFCINPHRSGLTLWCLCWLLPLTCVATTQGAEPPNRCLYCCVPGHSDTTLRQTCKLLSVFALRWHTWKVTCKCSQLCFPHQLATNQ